MADDHHLVPSDPNEVELINSLKQIWSSGDLTNGSGETICDVIETFSKSRRLPFLHDIIFQTIRESEKVIEFPENVLATYSKCISSQLPGQSVEIWKQLLKRKKRPRVWFQLFTKFLQHLSLPSSSCIPAHLVPKINECISATRDKLNEKLQADLKGCKSDWLLICYYFGEFLLLTFQENKGSGGWRDSTKCWWDHSYLGIEYDWSLFYEEISSYEVKYGVEYSLKFMLQKLRYIEIVTLQYLDSEEYELHEKKLEIISHIFKWLCDHPNYINASLLEKITPFLSEHQIYTIGKIVVEKVPSPGSVLLDCQDFQTLVISQILRKVYKATNLKIFRELSFDGKTRLEKQLNDSLLIDNGSTSHLQINGPLSQMMTEFFISSELTPVEEGVHRSLLDLKLQVSLDNMTPLNQTRVLFLLFSTLLRFEKSSHQLIISSILTILDGTQKIWFFSIVPFQAILLNVLKVTSLNDEISRELLTTFYLKLVRRAKFEKMISADFVETVLEIQEPQVVQFKMVLLSNVSDKDCRKRIFKSLKNDLASADELTCLEILTKLIHHFPKKVKRIEDQVIKFLAIVMNANSDFIGVPSSVNFLVVVFKHRSSFQIYENFTKDLFETIIGHSSKTSMGHKKKKIKTSKDLTCDSQPMLVLASNILAICNDEDRKLFLEIFLESAEASSCKLRHVKLVGLMINVFGEEVLDNIIPFVFETLVFGTETSIQLAALECFSSVLTRFKTLKQIHEPFLKATVIVVGSLDCHSNDMDNFTSIFLALNCAMRSILYHVYQADNAEAVLVTSIICRLVKYLIHASEMKVVNGNITMTKCLQSVDRTIGLYLANKSCSHFFPQLIATFIIESQLRQLPTAVRASLVSTMNRVLKFIDTYEKKKDLELVHCRLNQSGKEFLKQFINNYDKNYKFRGCV